MSLPPCKQMESEPTVRELMDRREIRGNEAQALASLPVSSLLDVDQISSALAQATVRTLFFLLSFLISVVLVMLVILQNTVRIEREPGNLKTLMKEFQFGDAIDTTHICQTI